MTDEARVILKDFIDCGSKHSCNECKAHEHITDGKTPYCELLSTYRGSLQDKINEVIEKN
jgi:hypothetical protein